METITIITFIISVLEFFYIIILDHNIRVLDRNQEKFKSNFLILDKLLFKSNRKDDEK